MLVQLNKCVVYGSNLERGHSGDGCLSSLILDMSKVFDTVNIHKLTRIESLYTH